jgi:putative ABC transport system permease protein
MFRNYLKIAYRYFVGHKLFSFINIFGLAIGIATCTIISLWVQRELSYDRFHKNVHRIYRIERELFRDKTISRWPITGGAYKQPLIDDFPEIENAVRFWGREFAIKDSKNFVHRQNMFAADNSIFDIFDFDLDKGDEKNALTKPKSVVLTRDNALKYFGTDDVIGKSLTFEWEDEPVAFKVTGILKDVPKNSHVYFDMLISISSYPNDRFENWRSNYLFTYILAKENTNHNELEEKLKSFVSQRLEPHYGDLLSQGFGIHKVLKMHLFPLTDIHLSPSPNWEIGVSGSKTSVYIFSSIAILILLIACINFMNLSTAHANKRAKEVGLRKTVGAQTLQLKMQFIHESMLLAFIALIFAIVLLSFFLPVYNNIFDDNLSFNPLLQAKSIILLLGTTLTVGFLSGLYPAFYLTNFDPANILKNGPKKGSGKSVFRRNMVVFQFIISIMLIIGTLTVLKQMRYIQVKSLGFDKENVVLIPTRSQQVNQSYEYFRNELLSNSQIHSLAVSSDLPGETFYSNTNFHLKEKSNEPVSLIVLMTDYDFIETYRMEMETGRIYSKDFKSDTAGTLILNEAAVQRFGWTSQEAIGKELSFFGDSNGKIVGVVKDFNFRSLHTKIEPMALILDPDYISAISVRIHPGNIKRTIDFIQKKWECVFPGEFFEFSFLDSRMNQPYENENKMQNIFIVFSNLSILVACLGLFGLSVFVSAERTKEIGIRKVLGASMDNILLLLSKEFFVWIVVSSFVAFPLAWFMMDKWLQNIAYRTNISFWIYFLSAGIALLVAMITVSFQSIRAAMANPVESLKYE